jgi:hypothetical protein
MNDNSRLPTDSGQAFYVCGEGHSTLQQTSPSTGENFITIHDIAGTITHTVKVNNEADQDALIERLDGGECWACEIPPDLEKRIKPYTNHETSEQIAARNKTTKLF